MGVSAPSLHIESTDSMILERTWSLMHKIWITLNRRTGSSTSGATGASASLHYADVVGPVSESFSTRVIPAWRVQRYRVQLCCVRRVCLGMQARTGYPSFVSLHIDMMQSENGDSFSRPAHNYIYDERSLTLFINMLIHAFVHVLCHPQCYWSNCKRGKCETR